MRYLYAVKITENAYQPFYERHEAQIYADSLNEKTALIFPCDASGKLQGAHPIPYLRIQKFRGAWRLMRLINKHWRVYEPQQL